MVANVCFKKVVISRKEIKETKLKFQFSILISACELKFSVSRRKLKLSIVLEVEIYSVVFAKD